MPFKDLIFEQGEEAHEALDILDRDGPQAALEHLAYLASEGDTRDHEVRDQSAAGEGDRQYAADGYLLTWHPRGQYIGLEQDLSYDPDAPEAG
jgi:hypothetical protein